MKKANHEKRIEKHLTGNAGTTLIEMIVCFALLAIFVTAAASIIASTTNLYYQVKGETYSGQVSDILMEKISSTIEGAKCGSDYSQTPVISSDGKYIELYDRYDTHLNMGAQNGEFLIQYYAKNSSNAGEARYATIWRFDKKLYFTYEIEELYFLDVNRISSTNSALLEKYGVDYQNVSYPNNVVLVLMTLKSDKYGTYRTVRPVKMYNVPTDYAWPVN